MSMNASPIKLSGWALILGASSGFGAATSVDKKNVLRNFISGMVIFSILSGVWIFLISRKYDRFTFSTAASFNYGLTNGYIHEYMLVPPSNATAISYWEDPSLSPIPILPQAIGHADAKNRSDSQTRISPSAKLAYRVRDLFTNIDATISVFQAFSKFFVIVIIAGAAWLPWKSGINTSIRHVGQCSRVLRIVAAKANGRKRVFRVMLRNGSFVEATSDHVVKAVSERRTPARWLRDSTGR